MRKGRGFRDTKRRGFDDDMPMPTYDTRGSRPSRPFEAAPRDAAPPQGPAVDATVKWFNAEKGFGFAELADGSGDVFMHIGALQAAGHDSVSPGAKLKVQVGQGAKGPQVTNVLEVDNSTAQPQRPSSGFGGGGGGGGGGARAHRHAPDPSTATEMSGAVKWFNAEKGFGFIASEDGGKDVFIHVSVLGRAGLTNLAEGQAVSMRVVDTPKGREAVSITLAG
ncbi:MAG: cold-shock protein [Alphaproteobacteria bacterium]|nr:cold-shock protein [Alphaproteobacteria bacterium]